MYDEDRAEEEIASRPKWQQARYWPDGFSNPPEYDTPTPTFSPAVEPPKPIVYIDPVPVLYDALRHLFAIASVCPPIVQGCPGVLEEASDAMKIAREAWSKRP